MKGKGSRMHQNLIFDVEAVLVGLILTLLNNLDKDVYDLSRVMGKPDFCLCEKKGSCQL